MSRGLGKVQRQVLKVLEDRGEWCWASEIETGVFEDISHSWFGIVRENGGMPCSASLRRGIHQLTKRGLICSGLVPTGRKGDCMGHGPRYLAAWLPTHNPPGGVCENVSRQTIEHQVIGAIRLWEDSEQSCEDEREPIGYRWLRRRVAEGLGLGVRQAGESWLCNATTRTLTRLAADGVIRLSYKGGFKRQIGVVLLSRQRPKCDDVNHRGLPCSA